MLDVPLAANEPEIQDAVEPKIKPADYLKFARDIAFGMVKRFPYVDKDEIISDAYLGLMEAVDKYHKVPGATFETYAGKRIKGAIMDELRKRSLYSRQERRKMRDEAQKHGAMVKEYKRRIVPLDEGLEVPDPDYSDIDQQLYDKQLLESILHATKRLSKNSRHSIMEYYLSVEESNLQEIGARLGLTADHIAVILNDARAKLRKALREFAE